MDVLYLSSLCSLREYERMFQKYGSTSSHASQKFNRMFVQGLVENGCHVDTLTQRIVLNPRKDDLQRPDETEDQIHYSYLPRYANQNINRVMTIWNAAVRILRWNKEHPGGVIICDIILGELSLGLCFAAKFAKLNAVAIVTDVPGIRAGETRTGIKAIPFKIKNAAIQAYDAYVFLTEQMNRALNPNGKPYVVIEGLADCAVLDEPNTLEGKFPEKVCMMAGLLEPIYGVDALLDAFNQVSVPEARLWFYGRGTSVDKIREAALRDGRIAYRGELTNREIVQVEKRATLLINPRPPEGEWTAYSFPSKNMEYMASGTPLVAYNLPCIPGEYIPYFYQVEDETLLQKLLEQLLWRNPEELHLFGLRAQQWIVSQKTPCKQTKGFVEMLNSTFCLKVPEGMERDGKINV